MKNVLIELIGGTPSEKEAEYKLRSACCWPEKINASILILHGENDCRVNKSQAEKLANKLNELGKLHELVVYPNGSHGLYENDTLIANGTWIGYQKDWHNITIHNVSGASYVMLLKDHEYKYTIITGSYPQIHHTGRLEIDDGVITCTSFVDTIGTKKIAIIVGILILASGVSIYSFNQFQLQSPMNDVLEEDYRNNELSCRGKTKLWLTG